MVGTFWSLVPAIVAIALALITKEVYSSLFIGIVIGALFYAIDGGLGFTGFFTHLLYDETADGDTYGFIACLADSTNVGILIFLVLLGALVAMMNKAGGSAAFGRWAKKHIKTKVGAQIATIVLGIFIFIDDYFNCLTVGSVMKPVTDKFGVSREKLAYIIDATAAPICIIAPISSWAASVASYLPESENGMQIFIDAIPFNFYALVTIIMMFAMVFMRFEFGEMSKYEKALAVMSEAGVGEEDEVKDKAIVLDLLLPVIVLIVLCILGMIYTGGFFDADTEGYHNFKYAFSDADSSFGLSLGALGGIIFAIAYYMIRRVLSFGELMDCLPEGFKAMVPAILILSMAWTLNNMTGSLGAKGYVADLVAGSAGSLKMFLPAIIFIVACLLAFSTGTSWGTFGILIPICIAAFPSGTIRIISISACMAGAVCGDHCSPISDTTIMASAGAQCDHVNHVRTQLPYAVAAAAISFVGYIVAGLSMGLGTVAACIISWAVTLVVLFSFLFYMKARQAKKAE